jgi:tetratricopeptide (TPR) repeat protein
MSKLNLFLLLLLTSSLSCNKDITQPCDDHFINGNNYLLANDIENAHKEFDKAILENPKNVNAIYGIGTIYFLQNEYEKALEYFDKSILMNPKFMMAYSARANTKQILGKRKEALEDYKKAIELNPKFLSALVQASNIEAESGNYQNAINYMTKSIEIKPNFSKLYIYRGLFYHSLKDKEIACKDLNKAKEMGEITAQKYLHMYCN